MPPSAVPRVRSGHAGDARPGDPGLALGGTAEVGRGVDHVKAPHPVLRRIPRRTEEAMMQLARLVSVVAGLVLFCTVTPWGGPPDPTVSGAYFNTAGGAGALSSVIDGYGGHTSFGYHALLQNTTGVGGGGYGRSLPRRACVGMGH